MRAKTRQWLNCEPSKPASTVMAEFRRLVLVLLLAILTSGNAYTGVPEWDCQGYTADGTYVSVCFNEELQQRRTMYLVDGVPVAQRHDYINPSGNRSWMMNRRAKVIRHMRGVYRGLSLRRQRPTTTDWELGRQYGDQVLILYNHYQVSWVIVHGTESEARLVVFPDGVVM